MTVIMGINLSDKIYIAADTRVSRIVGADIVTVHDNMLKVENIRGTVIACAGDAALAAHIIASLRSGNLIDRGIDTLRNSIEAWIASVCEEYWQKLGRTTHGTYIFAGRSTQRRKRIPRAKMNSLLDSYFSNPELNGKPASLKHGLANDIQGKSEQLKTTYYDTKLFAVSVSHQGIQVDDADWGQHLIYGPTGLDKSDVSPSDIARLEFSQDDEKNSSIMMLPAYFYNMVKNRSLQGVSSTVVPLEVNQNGDVYLRDGSIYTLEDIQEKQPTVKAISELKVIEDSLCRVEDGQNYALQPLVANEKDTLTSLII